MDSNEIIKKLIRIAEKQQLIINKLAQTMAAVPSEAAPSPPPGPSGGATAGWDINRDQIQDMVDAMLSRRDPKAVGKIDVSSARLDKEHGQLTVGFVVDPSASALWQGVSNVLSQVLTNVELKDTAGGAHKASTTSFNA